MGGVLYKSAAVRPAASILLALYAIGVAFVVLWPSPVDDQSRTLIVRILKKLHERGLPVEINYAFVEFAANVAMFVPLGFLLGMLLGPRRWWIAVLICLGLSASIEAYQYVALPERYATVQDVVANTSGGIVGALLAGLMIIPLRWPRAPRPPVYPPPAGDREIAVRL